MRWALLCCFALLAAGTPRAAEPEVDHLALAAVLLRDGHIERAATALRELDPDAKGLDRRRFFTLSALVALERRQPDEAEAALAQAGEPIDPNLWLLLAQTHFQAEACPAAIRSLDRAGAAAEARPAAWRMRVDCARRADDPAGAWAALQAGARAHPDDAELARLRVLLLVELGLPHAAADAGAALLARPDASADDAVTLGEAMRRARLLPEAIQTLEEARLRHPDEPRITQALARAHLDAGRPFAAAELFAQLAWTYPEHAADAAELYRRAGAHDRALRLNARVPDAAARAKQRLGLLVEAERYEAALALEPRLSRLGLLTHDEIRYALAYSAWMAGRDDSERLLAGISDPEVFRRAADLRQAMSACRADPGRCL